MARNEIKIKLDLDARQAQREIKKAREETGKLEDSLEDVESAGKALARVIDAESDRMVQEIDATRRAVDAMERALDGAGDFTATDAVAHLKRIGLTADEIEADVDALAASLRKAGDVKLHATAQGFDDIGDAVTRADRDLIDAGDRYQSLGSAVRGVSDELGFASAGVNSFAIGALDAGDVAVQLGEKFGLSAAAAGKLGAVLGGAGIAAIVLGSAIPALQMLMSTQDEVNEETQEAIDRTLKQVGGLEQLKAVIDSFGGERRFNLVETLFGGLEQEDFNKLNESLAGLGVTYQDLFDVVAREGGSIASMTAGLLEADESLAGFVKQAGFSAEEIARAIQATDNWNSLLLELAGSDEILARQLASEDGFREFYNNVEQLEDIWDEIDLGAVVEGEMERIAAAGGDAARRLDAFRRAFPQLSDLEILQQLSAVNEEVADSAEDAADAAEDQAEAERKVREQIEKQIDEVLDLIDARNEMAGAAIDAERAELDYLDAVEELNTVLGDAEVSERDRRRAVLDTLDATDRMVVAQLEAEGVVVESTRGQQLYTQAMLDQARTVGGPLAREIINHVARVNGIPADKLTDINVALDQGDVDRALRILDEEIGSTTVSPTVDVKQENLNRERAEIDRILGRDVNVRVRTSRGNGRVFASHTGSWFGPGDTKVITGPQAALMTAGRAGRLPSDGESRRMMSDQSAAPAPNVVIVATDRTVDEIRAIVGQEIGRVFG